MISVDEALQRILAAVPEPAGETVPLGGAHGRVLAAPLTAAHNQPPFDASSMDGYAVRAADVAPGRRLKLVGTAQAGQRFQGMMGPGQCVRIFTGAPMPIGADTVVVQEEASDAGGEIGFSAAIEPGRNVRRRGNDFAEGETLLPPGTALTPPALALAAAANRPVLTVARRPRLALLATGDELVPVGGTLGPDQIIASNSVALGAMMAPHCAEIRDLGLVRDDRKAIEAALLRAFDAGIEVVVTTGGASVGERDHVREVLVDLGVRLDFWTIAMRPGKPLMFGTRGKTLIFGLPGNPVSALVTAMVLVLPALAALNGGTRPPARQLRLPLAAPLPENGPRRHFRRARLVTSDGLTAVEPLAETDSAHLSSFTGADALIVQPEHAVATPAGAPVEVLLFPGG